MRRVARESGASPARRPGSVATAPARMRNATDPAGGRGRPLERTTRARFESQFGHDFSRIRIHDLPRESPARAVTVGDRIAIADGEQHDQALLAHELAHVVQQRDRSASHSGAAPRALEAQADAAANASRQGRPMPPLSRAPAGVPQAEGRDEESKRVFAGMRDVGIGFGIVGAVAGAIIGAAAGPLGGVLGGLLGGVIGSALGVGVGALAGYLNDRRGGGGKLDEKRIAEVLKYLAGRKADSYSKIEGKNDSDDLARDAVRLWKQDPAKFPLDVDQRRILVMELIDGRVTEDDEDAVLDILERSSDADILTMFVVKDAVSESYKPPAAVEIKEVAAALPSAGKQRLDALIARRFPTVAPDQPKQTMKDRPISDPFVVQNMREVYEPIKGLTGVEMGGVFLKMNDGSLRHESGGPGAWSTAIHDIIADALVKWGDRNNPPYYVDVLCTYHTHPGDKDTAGTSRMAPSGADVQGVTKSMYQGSSILGKEHYVITPFSVYAITPGGGVEALGSTETVLGVKPSAELVKPKTALEYPLP